MLSAARDNVAYVAAFMYHLEHPAALPDHLKVGRGSFLIQTMLFL